MIQRIQSIWLLLASIAAFAGITFPFYAGTDAQGIPSSTLDATDSLPLLINTIIVGIISLLAIFLYKNRKLQINLCLIAILAQITLIYFYYAETKRYMGGTFALTSILEPLVVVLLILAILGIRKDDKIIKESNRLR